MSNKNTQLSPRLTAVASFVPKGCSLADIGTDHARVPIYLINSGVIENAIASDIGKGPLGKAAENLEYFGLSHKVQLRLADGMKGINDNEADCFIIAGMGGELISDILRTYIPKGTKRLILQPMTNIHLVRQALIDVGFSITYEEIVPELNKMYIVIVAEPGEMKLTENELYLPPTLKTNSLYAQYLDYRLSLMKSSARQALQAGADTQLVREFKLFSKAKDEIKKNSC